MPPDGSEAGIILQLRAALVHTATSHQAPPSPAVPRFDVKTWPTACPWQMWRRWTLTFPPPALGEGTHVYNLR